MEKRVCWICENIALSVSAVARRSDDGETVVICEACFNKIQSIQPERLNEKTHKGCDSLNSMRQAGEGTPKRDPR